MTARLDDIVKAAGEPLAIAVELSTLARGDVTALVGLLAEPSFAPRHRVVILLAIALVLADGAQAAVPDRALDAVEAPAVVAAAIDSGLGGALTAVLSFAPLDATLQPTRKLIGRRLLAADITGPHVARLLLDAGDVERAAETAAFDLIKTTSAELRAGWLHLLARWSAHAIFIERVVALLDEEFLRALLRDLDDVPGIAAADARRLRSAAVWALSG